MANAEIVVTRKHGNVFIGAQPIKINLSTRAESSEDDTQTTAVLGKAKLGKMKLGAK